MLRPEAPAEEAAVAVRDGSVEVYPEGDPEWVVPVHLAPFDCFVKNLQRFHGIHDSELRGCRILCEPAQVHITYNVLDDRCPALAIIWHLRHKGWQAVDRRVVHETPAILNFDCQEAVKFKSYYQVLCVLEEALRHSSTVPSRECVAYYQTLLRGLNAEPGGAAKSYQLIMNENRKKRGRPMQLVPLEDAETPLPLPGQGDPDGILLPQPEAPPPPPPPLPAPDTVRTGAARKRKANEGVAPIEGGGGHQGGGAEAGGRRPGSSGDPAPGRDPDGILCPGGAPPEGGEGAGVDQDPDGFVQGPIAPHSNPRRELAPRTIVDGLDGTKIVYQPYTTPSGGSYPNFILRCTREGHPAKCKKTCGMLPANCAELGPIQPLCFLYAWIDYDDPDPARTHGNSFPPLELVKQVAERRGDEIKAILDRVGISY